MLYGIHVSAPAKLNLHLRVLPMRSDGFHNIESVFQQIPLCDELDVVPVPDVPDCTVTSIGMVLPQNNTLTATYAAFRNLTGIPHGVTVHVTKRIPDGAGLGGGSSDAAAFLHALDVIFETGLSQERKQAIAGTVGSDVFFFVDGRQNSGTGYEPFCAVVTGRGETIRPVVPRKDLYFILVCPEIHSSTRAAYQLVDDCYHSGMNVMHELLDPLETIYARPVADWTFGNSFTVPLVGAYPCIGDAMQDIASTGADFVQMSGSGSTVFGIFADAADAESAYASLCRKWKKCFLLV